jgi:hypothetical protein
MVIDAVSGRMEKIRLFTATLSIVQARKEISKDFQEEI